MTPEDHALDPDFFLTDQPITLYRLARARYANLSGIGAAFAPGRWNRPDQEAIYTSTEVGVPLLERLVHTPKDTIPSNLALMKIRLLGGWRKLGSALFIGEGKDRRLMRYFRTPSEARQAFDDILFWRFSRPFFAIAVPSVIVPVWNVVLFPREAGFWDHVSVESVEPFQFDPRLFPENAAVEATEEEIKK